MLTHGSSYPIGATWSPHGVNFSVYSRSATSVRLDLFDRVEDGKPSRSIMLHPEVNRTYHYWHIFVPKLAPGQLYGFRVQGKGPKYDADKLLLDPYGRAVAVPPRYDRKAANRKGNNAAVAAKSVVVDMGAYDWGDDKHPRHPFAQTVIYEMHVRGFTRHPSSGVAPERAGTYAGLIEKIPHLVELGVTAVELLPIFAFDPGDAPEGLTNYWGYSPMSFFAPHPAYAAGNNPVDEFRDLVKALHRAGIEVILDVVYNHTTEGDDTGPTLCWRGYQDDLYYLRDAEGKYANYTGCGNTLNANASVVRRMIVDSLCYWVQEMHVDGFRFDLASILTRGEDGKPHPNPPVLWQIETHPALAGTKLIAEAWDAGGLYQVGHFIGDHWREWNGRFRDDIRSFLKGDEGTVGHLAPRLLASPDLFGHENREPEQSVNFVTCHDGFTLNDLVSYNAKHNLANRENNRDGDNDSRSWNCGVEGPSSDPVVEGLRNRQIKNFLALTLLALGVPMVTMGDEMRRTQQGNNNAYCQDNEISWLDWSLLEKHHDVFRFLRELITFRLGLGPFRKDRGLSLEQVLRRSRISWHGIKLNSPDWSDSSHSLAVTVELTRQRYHLMLNAYWEELVFELPEGTWHRKLDTFLKHPHDIEEGAGPELPDASYTVGPRSLALCYSSSLSTLDTSA